MIVVEIHEQPARASSGVRPTADALAAMSRYRHVLMYLGGGAMRITAVTMSVTLSLVFACGQEGPAGPPGPPGPSGANGADGTNGATGTDGTNGNNGTNGADGSSDAGTDAPPGPTSGTRIKASKATVTTTTTTSDGAKSVTSYEISGWFDTLRNEPCSFQPAGDGKTRCLPSTLARTDYSGGSYYQDAACTQKLAFTLKQAASVCGPTTTPAPPNALYLLFSTTGANGCSGAGIRAIGTVIVPATVYLKSGASCIGIASTPTAYDYFAPGAEIAPTEFVESTTTIVTQ